MHLARHDSCHKQPLDISGGSATEVTMSPAGGAGEMHHAVPFEVIVTAGSDGVGTLQLSLPKLGMTPSGRESGGRADYDPSSPDPVASTGSCGRFPVSRQGLQIRVSGLNTAQANQK